MRQAVTVSTHSRLKAAEAGARDRRKGRLVSTHSRLKAAGWKPCISNQFKSFNTQPPEGGCPLQNQVSWNHPVSTHSRLKAAGRILFVSRPAQTGFNTQPPEGGWLYRHVPDSKTAVSTHSRLKAAVRGFANGNDKPWFQHTAA